MPLNRLWIDDYCVWLQSPEADGRLKRLAERYVARAALDKSDFPKWKLPMIEKCFADMRIVAAAEAAAAQESGTESSSASSSSEGESESEDESGGGEDDGGDGRGTSDDRGAAEEKIDDLHAVAEAPTPVAVPPGAGAGEGKPLPKRKCSSRSCESARKVTTNDTHFFKKRLQAESGSANCMRHVAPHRELMGCYSGTPMARSISRRPCPNPQFSSIHAEFHH